MEMITIKKEKVSNETNKTKYIVEGDHPILRRIYDHCPDLGTASKLVQEMIEANYENITINGKEIPKDEH